MDEKRLSGTLGLSLRARQAVTGEGPCLSQIRSGQCALLLVDSGASENTKDRYESACRFRQIPMALVPEGMLSKAMGRSCMAVGMLQGGLCEKVKGLLEDAWNVPPQPADTNHKDRNVGGASVE
ncbi:MAG: hypothetical protein IJ246_13180 [Clostridia bacterium]|nr:hypothetical protein [Clostridia bacterium]